MVSLLLHTYIAKAMHDLEWNGSTLSTDGMEIGGKLSR